MKEIIAERLQKARKSVGLTQEKVAQLLNVSRNKIINMEKGDDDYEITMLEKLSKLYGCSLEYLAGIEEIEDKEDELFFRTLESNSEFKDYEIMGWSNMLLSNIKALKEILSEVPEVEEYEY
ncbi:helix-turn-helix transcriptional regulator [Thermoanaerobacter sp. YS13]|uniref:helix-turn-helix transcriptional regulator n=1 Tax=Thermoanaerobacter sp. YS13 TaxID=1511746 RepID=UPI00068E2C1B|nr:helix-turn-helix transcriptional regulator [Thermoanaerobacter sp. YS13]